MRVGLIAIAGVKLQARKFIDLGITQPHRIDGGWRVFPTLAARNPCGHFCRTGSTHFVMPLHSRLLGW